MTCRKCGAPATALEVARVGEPVAAGALCKGCLAAAVERAKVLDLEFQWLIAHGVNRTAANKFLISKIDGAPAS